MLPLQQGRALSHPCPVGAQHRPASHRALPQHPVGPVQSPPGVAQHRLTPATAEHPLGLAQHPGAAAPGVQLDASPKVHGAVRQSPDWQLSPAQQSALAAHRPLADWQHRPLSQRWAPQQPSLRAQAAPVLAQQRPSTQLRPARQHPGASAPAAHAAASARLHWATRQTPCSHPRPAQQSRDAVQVSLERRHAQRPASQAMTPQHWGEAVQLPPASRQHARVAGAARHERASQHSAAVRHTPVPARQVSLGRAQRLLVLQRSPAPQGVDEAQHAWASPPHGGATQAALAQLAPAAQGALQRAQ